MPGFNLNNSSLRICVDRTEHHAVSGRVLSSRLTKPLPFSDLNSLALQMETVFDAQDFPQAYQRMRTFQRGGEAAPLAASDPAEGMSAEMVRGGRGEITAFDVLVVSRRSSSWQGVVDWLDGSATQEFASFLELMHLIDKKLF